MPGRRASGPGCKRQCPRLRVSGAAPGRAGASGAAAGRCGAKLASRGARPGQLGMRDCPSVTERRRCAVTPRWPPGTVLQPATKPAARMPSVCATHWASAGRCSGEPESPPPAHRGPSSLSPTCTLEPASFITAPSQSPAMHRLLLSTSYPLSSGLPVRRMQHRSMSIPRRSTTQTWLAYSHRASRPLHLSKAQNVAVADLRLY